MYTLFAVCTPGLEPFLVRELVQLGVVPADSAEHDSPTAKALGQEAGGVEFRGSLHDVYRANLHLRTASRVLARLGSFRAVLFPELRRKASHLPWEEHLAPGQPIALRVTCRRSRLYHDRAVAERVAGAIADRLGHPLPLQKPKDTGRESRSQLIIVRFFGNRCTISVDSSGELLHRRGYRLATAKAPLRETLAAGMLLTSHWDTTSPLLDPFCGSGTIPVEAALLARQQPPGRNRHFAFMDWPNFQSVTWESLVAEAQKLSKPTRPVILASDRDAGAIESAKANAERAGVQEYIEFSSRAVSAIDPPPGPGWVVTNLPFGVRISKDRELRNLYIQFGKVLQAKCSGWRVAILSGSLKTLGSIGPELSERISVMHGGLRAKLVLGRVPETPA